MQTARLKKKNADCGCDTAGQRLAKAQAKLLRRGSSVLATTWPRVAVGECGTHLWEIRELRHGLGELDKVLDFNHAAVLLVRHLAEEPREVLRFILRGTWLLHVRRREAQREDMPCTHVQ